MQGRPKYIYTGEQVDMGGDFNAVNQVDNQADKARTTTVHPWFSWNFQYCEIVVERYPSLKLAAEIHFYYLKNSVQFGTEHIFCDKLKKKTIIIPCRVGYLRVTSIAEIFKNFTIFPAVSKINLLAIFVFLTFCQILMQFLKLEKCVLAASFGLRYLFIQLS